MATNKSILANSLGDPGLTVVTTAGAGSVVPFGDPTVTTDDPSGSTLGISFANLVAGGLPSQSGQAGNVLGTNGTTAAWVVPAGGTGGGLPPQSGQAGKFLGTDGTSASWSMPPGGGGSGTVTSITAVSPLTGGVITSAGSIGLGTVPINLGGTGQTTAPLAINALLPAQTSNSGKVLGTDGSVASWVAGGGGGGTPGGSLGQLQYNNPAGTFAGAANWSIGSGGELVGASQAAPTIITSGGQTWFDSTQKVKSINQCGLAANLGGVIWRQGGAGTAVANVTNVGSPASLMAGGSPSGSLVIPANSLIPGKIIVIEVFGTYGVTGTPTLALVCRLGPTGTIFIVGGGRAFTAAVTNKQWNLRCILYCRGPVGATNTFVGDGRIVLGGAASDAGFNIIMSASTTSASATSPITIDTTVANTVDVGAQWDTANAANTIQLLGGLVEIKG